MKVHGNMWGMILGDSVEVVGAMDDESVGYSIFSPPFSSLYVYSNSPRDMGNCKSHAEFFDHLGFLTSELYRVLKPGRCLSFHCMNLPLTKERDGVIGLYDFRGDLIRAFEKVGFVFASEVTIWKDPVTAMQRTKALGLLHKQLKKDSAMSRQGIPDYLVTMRKPGENLEPIKQDMPVEMWQRYASPVWALINGLDQEGFGVCEQDINPSDTLQYESAREHEDERHICPLQREVARRGIRLWSNKGDVVLSPFAGIGTEVYEAVAADRFGLGVELKESYFKQAVANVTRLESQTSLFAEAA